MQIPAYDLAPVILGVTLILSASGVLILRPIAKRLGGLLEAMTIERSRKAGVQEVARLTEAVNRLTDRVETLEDRQDFTERVMASVDSSEKPSRLRARPDL
jgi:hypothetical protein